MNRTFPALLALSLLAPATADAQLQPETSPRKADKRIVLRTTMGDLVLALYPDVAPKHVEQITKLVMLGAYDTTAFVRIEPEFVAQLGDVDDREIPLTEAQRAAIHTLPSEFSPTLKHHVGTVSMARPDGEPNGARTSFSILLTDAPHLDNQYTIFGELEQGLDVLEAIRRVETGPSNRPITRVTVDMAVAVSEDQLPSLGLRGPIAQPRVTAAAAIPSSTSLPQLSLVAVMMLLGICTFVASGRFPAKIVGSLGLLVVFVGFFLLLITLLPQRLPHWFSVLFFFATIGLFKLMNRFESPRP